MPRQPTCLVIIVLLLVMIPGQARAQAQKVQMDPAHGLKPINVKTDPVPFKGQPPVRVTDPAPAGTGDEGRLVILTDTEFESGTIEVDLAGEVGPGAAGGARGFGGLGLQVTVARA